MSAFPLTTEYSPPRFWWLTRLGMIAIGLLGAMIGSYWAVGADASRRIEREVAHFRALPVVQPEDTGGTPQDLLDPLNPAFHLDKALRALPAYTPAQMAWHNQEPFWPPLAQEDVDVIRTFDAGLGPSLDALRQAREARASRPYRFALGPISMAMLLPSLNSYRDFCNRIGWSMLLAHHDGNLARVLECALGNQALAEASTEYGPTLVSTLVACGISASNHDNLLIVAGHHPLHRTLDDELHRWKEVEPAVRELIDALLSPEFYDRMSQAGFGAEWIIVLGVRDPPVGMGYELPPRNVLTAPMLDANAADLLEAHRQTHQMLGEHALYPERMAAATRIRNVPQVNSVAAMAARKAFYDFRPPVERPLSAYARVRMTGHVAAVALATRMFEVDYGRLPKSLEQLVPEYLPYLPVDPFDPAGRPLRYRFEENLPIIYSVGPNGMDEGGNALPEEPPIGAVRPVAAYSHDGRDYVYPLRYTPETDYKPLEWLRKRQRAAAEGASPQQ